MSGGADSTAAMPPMMYGTAWKKDRTADLVYEAIKAGFRGIDTAAMKRHYDEALTGEGICRAISEGIVSRKDLFIQTKFTPNDDSLPNRDAPIPSQIHTSLAASLSNLSTPDHQTTTATTTPYLDAVLLHAPYPNPADTLVAWQTLQLYLPSSPDPSRAGKVLQLGLSNVTLPILTLLVSSSAPSPPPTIIQNRFYSKGTGPAAAAAAAAAAVATGEAEEEEEEDRYDAAVRAWCKQHGAKYQGFWTLTGNARVWRNEGFVRELAEGAGISRAAAWYVLLMDEGVVVLNGTGDIGGHMREDLEAWGRVEAWRAAGNEAAWQRCWTGFRRLLRSG
ncbi:hypothetical protein MFIFM68171_03204 [Madurella fahalii]|uniref:NADP-dependent oxidoreductase domain-containing protein n=1 Tax=Madurella fahalii TaxID=1157608 RepID=A0ABQ0G5H1_9PEZI